MMTLGPDKFAQIFIRGAGWSLDNPTCGKFGRVVKVDHSHPHPYAVLYEGHTDDGFYLWIRRQDFEYVHGRLSSWAALDAIEKSLDHPDAAEKVREILDQYKNGRT